MARRVAVYASLALSAAAALILVSCGRGAAVRARASIIVITIDTLRADRVNARTTPALAALAREAVAFDNAVTVAPLTLPAHASLLTGAYPPGHGVRDNEAFVLPADVPTYPEWLRQRGYGTAAFVSAAVLDHQYGLNRGFDRYDDEMSGPERSGAATLARAERWLETAPQPFFLWAHLFEPHAPYLTGSYDTEVRDADTALDEFFNFLRGKHLWDGIVLSVSSDHGESLGEHRERTHGFFLYDATMRIPWILKAPGLAPRSFPHLVRIVDELPTVIDLAGAERRAGGTPGRAPDGISLVPFLSSGRSPGVEAYGETFLPRDQFGWSELTSIRTARLKYIEAPTPELYDLGADPSEAANAIAARNEDAAKLRRGLAAVAHASGAAAQPAKADPALSEKLMSLGYLGAAPGASGAPGMLADPKDKVEVYNLAMSALELSEGGDVAAALSAVQQAERLDAGVAQIAFLKGTLLGRLGRYDEAATALERTLVLNPRYTAARFKLALAWLRMGQADRAAGLLQDVVREQPDDFRAWHNLAAIAYSRGDLDQAEKLERKAVALSPEYADAWNTIGAIALVQKRTDAAVDALTAATRYGPRNAQAFQNLALALHAAGHGDRARDAADRACALDKKLCTPRDRP